MADPTTNTTPSSGLRPPPLTLQFFRLVKTQEFCWFLGHVLAITFFALHFLYSFFSPASSLRYYRFTILAILLTYTIVIKQVHFRKLTLRNVTFNKLIRDENVQYFTLASVLYLASFAIGPVSASLYSFVIFGTFHVLRYFQRNLLPLVVPKLSSQQQIDDKIAKFTTRFYSQAMVAAAYGEVVLLVLLAFQIPGAILFNLIYQRQVFVAATKVFVVLFVMVFDKLRFDSNQYTKVIVQQFDAQANQVLARLNNPTLSHWYNGVFKGVIIGKYISKISIPKEVKAKK